MKEDIIIENVEDQQPEVNIVTTEEQSTAQSNITDETQNEQLDFAELLERKKTNYSRNFNVTLSTLIAASAHFGERKNLLHPKMRDYIQRQDGNLLTYANYTKYVIALDVTLQKLKAAYTLIKNITQKRGKILFVYTQQSEEMAQTIKNYAKLCEGYYITNRWPPGLLTNFITVHRTLKQARNQQRTLSRTMEDEENRMSKKDMSVMQRKINRVMKNLEGLMKMSELPQVIVVIGKETIALKEAKKLNIPVIGLVDLNVDPSLLTCVVPIKDNASSSIAVAMDCFADAVLGANNKVDTPAK